MACFDRNLAALRAQAALLERADPAIVRGAIDATQRLPGVDDCADATLAAMVPLPTSTTERARIRALDEKLAASSADILHDRPAERLRVSESLLAEARSIDYPPLLARALENDFQTKQQNLRAADQVLTELADAAAASRDDVTLAKAWSHLIAELARQSRLEEAAALEPVARSASTRAGSPPDLLHRIETALGDLEAARKQPAAAQAHFRAALVSAQHPSQRRSTLMKLASSLVQSRKIGEALPLVEEALTLTELIHGPRHPVYAQTLLVLGQVLSYTGTVADVPRARDALERALAIQRAAFGEQHAAVAKALSELAGLEIAVGRQAEAESLARRALAITERQSDPALTKVSLDRLAGAIAGQGRLAEARPYYERSLAEAEKLWGKENDGYAGSEVSLANRLLELGDHAAARAYATHAMGVFDRLKLKPGTALAVRIVALCDLRAGETEHGIAGLEKAVALCRTPGCYLGNLEAMLFSLGEHLILTGTDRKRGMKVLQEARAGLAAMGRTDDVEELDAWLKKHGEASR